MSEVWNEDRPSSPYSSSDPWQDSSPSLSCALYFMRKSEIFVDVIFKKDKLPCLYAHKLILAMWSPYFADLMKQSDQSATLTINFNQDIDAMETVLNYIYSDSDVDPCFTKIPIEKIIQVIEITERFQIKQIYQRCISSLQRRKINPENVIDFFDYGLKKDLETIVKKCIKVFTYHGISMKNLRQDISVSTLLGMLTLERLSVQSESRLLNIAISWLSHPSNKSFKSEVLSFIDLSTIEWNEYQNVCKHFPNFFSISELSSILLAVAHQDARLFPHWYKPEMLSVVQKHCDTCVFVNKRLTMLKNSVRTKPKQQRDLTAISQAFEFTFQQVTYARLLHIEFTFGPRDVKNKYFRVKFSRSGSGLWEEGKLDTPQQSDKYVLKFQEPLMIKNTEGISLKFHFWKGSLGNKIQLVKNNKVENPQLKESSKKDIVEIKIKSSNIACYCEKEEVTNYLVSSFYFNLCENHVSYLIRKRIESKPEKAVVKMETGNIVKMETGNIVKMETGNIVKMETGNIVNIQNVKLMDTK